MREFLVILSVFPILNNAHYLYSGCNKYSGRAFSYKFKVLKIKSFFDVFKKLCLEKTENLTFFSEAVFLY